jgi:hypothetical protein
MKLLTIRHYQNPEKNNKLLPLAEACWIEDEGCSETFYMAEATALIKANFIVSPTIDFLCNPQILLRFRNKRYIIRYFVCRCPRDRPG